MLMKFSSQLVHYRKSKGMSQEELAALVGVSRQAVSKWETEEALPDLNKAIALAEALGVSLDALCGNETAVSSPAPEQSRSADQSKRFRPLMAAIFFLLLCGSFFMGMRFSSKPAPDVSVLPETVSATGVQFHMKDGAVAYQFIPGIVSDAYTYQITFAGSGDSSYTFDVACSGGVCSGSAAVGEGIYLVTALILDGERICTAPLASELTVSGGTVTWLPVAASGQR